MSKEVWLVNDETGESILLKKGGVTEITGGTWRNAPGPLPTANVYEKLDGHPLQGVPVDALKAARAMIRELCDPVDGSDDTDMDIIADAVLAAALPLIPAPPVTKDTSDGYHTFRDLYDHRRALTAALCKAMLRDESYRSKRHHPEDGPMFDDSFIVGIDLIGQGEVRYHYNLRHWDEFDKVTTLPHALKWDDAGPEETVRRLLAW